MRLKPESFFLFLLFFARCVINFHRQTNTFCSADETENFFVFFFTTQSVASSSYSDVSTIRPSTKPILEKNVLAKNKTENWLSIDICKLFSQASFRPGLCFHKRLRRVSVVRTRFMYRSSLPSTIFFYECHSVVGIGCVSKFEVERRIMKMLTLSYSSSSTKKKMFIDGST